MLQHENASDFISTLPNASRLSLEGLKQAFKQNYFRSPELKWRDASDLWNKPQQPQELVADYVVRLHKAAKKLHLSEETLNYAFLNGLRPGLRTAVVQHGVKSMQESIQLAKIAEAAIEPVSDQVPVLLMKALESQNNAVARQSEEIKQLTARVAALSSETPPATSTGEIFSAEHKSGDTQQQQRRQWTRNFKPTPQNKQW